MISEFEVTQEDIDKAVEKHGGDANAAYYDNCGCFAWQALNRILPNSLVRIGGGHCYIDQVRYRMDGRGSSFLDGIATGRNIAVPFTVHLEKVSPLGESK